MFSFFDKKRFLILPEFSALMFILNQNIVYAAGYNDTNEVKTLFEILGSMSNIFFAFAYGAMVLIFAVGVVKSGLSAQISQQFGMARRLSQEQINFIGGVFVFCLGIASYPLAKNIIGLITSETGMQTAPTVDKLELPGGL